MPIFDTATIYLLTGFSSLLSSAILFWLRGDHRGSGPALTLFAGGVFALGFSFTCFALRPSLLGSLAPMLGNAGFGFSAVLYWLGAACLCGNRPRVAAASTALAAYLLALALLAGTSSGVVLIRVVLSSAFLVTFIVLTALEAHRSQWIGTLKSVRLLRDLMIVYAVVFVIRLIAFLLEDLSLEEDAAAAGSLHLLISLVFGSVPFALTVIVLSIANSQLSSELGRLAATDELTGLVSRRSLQESARRMLEQAGRSGNVALLMIDVDNFKSVNDRYGHSLGDEVLQHIAKVLRRELREEALIVRYGGDEFLALVPVANGNESFVVAERLRSAAEASPYRIGTNAVGITLSIGVSLHRAGTTLRQLFEEADKCAYRAKAGGRNRVVAEDTAVAAVG